MGWIGLVLLGAVTGGCGDDGATSSGGMAGSQDANACGRGREMAYGRRVDEQRGCLAESAPVGCRDVPQGCPAAIAVVRDARGDLYWFPDLCLPDGVEVFTDMPAVNWDLCNPLPREPFKGCDGLSESICAREPDCALIKGIQYDPAQGCRAERVSTIGCRQATDVCAAGIRHVRFFDMQFQVADGCTPSKSVSLDAPSEPVDAWAICASFP